MNFEKMDLHDLKKVQREVERAIDSLKQRRISDARAELEARARELGFSLHELTAMTGSSEKRTRNTAKPIRGGTNAICSKVKPKYRNPRNRKETWSGRGRRPRWLTAELSNTGAKLEDFLI